MTQPCIPCIQQAQRFVGAPGLYGLQGVRLGSTKAAEDACFSKGGNPVHGDGGTTRCMFQDGSTYSMDATSRYDIKRDVVSAVTAFSLPLAYHYGAPKKWKRPGKLGGVAAVVALYFATSFIYGKVAAT